MLYRIFSLVEKYRKILTSSGFLTRIFKPISKYALVNSTPETRLDVIVNGDNPTSAFPFVNSPITPVQLPFDVFAPKVPS